MSFDNINSSFAGYGRQGPQRPNAFASPSPAFGRSGPGSKPDAFMDNGIPFARAASESFTKEGTQTVVANTVHAMAAEGLNRFIPNGSRGAQEQSSKITTKMAANASKAVTYADRFNLGQQQVPIHKLSRERLSAAFQSNIQGGADSIKPSGGVGNYFKNTVVRGNVQPITNMFTNPQNREVGTGLLRSVGLGFMGFDIFKNARIAYRHAKAQEDGTFRSKLRTYAQTAKAAAKYTARDGTGWEFAAIGATLGKAVLPIALGGISFGGIILGAVFGLAAEKALDKVLHTGKHDPNHDPTKHGDVDFMNEPSRFSPGKK